MSANNPWQATPDEGYWRSLMNDADPADANSNAAPFLPPSEAGWMLAEKSYKQGDTLELRVVGYNRGGLLVDLGGLNGFVPSSQLSSFPRQPSEEARAAELARYVDTMMRLKVIELERTRNRLILSQRVTHPPFTRAENLLSSITPEQIHKGIVRNVTDFGAFIDLGGIEGLVHVSELSWEYVKHPGDVLTPGQEVEIYVLDVDREQKRIACSIKRLKPNPWQDLAQRVKPGDWMQGRVTSVVPFGAFVRLAQGVEGLIHASELAEGRFLHPRDVVQEGQEVRVRVLEIDTMQKRIKLSLRDPNRASSSQSLDEMMPPPPDAGYWKSLAESEM